TAIPIQTIQTRAAAAAVDASHRWRRAAAHGPLRADGPVLAPAAPGATSEPGGVLAATLTSLALRLPRFADTVGGCRHRSTQAAAAPWSYLSAISPSIIRVFVSTLPGTTSETCEASTERLPAPKDEAFSPTPALQQQQIAAAHYPKSAQLFPRFATDRPPARSRAGPQQPASLRPTCSPTAFDQARRNGGMDAWLPSERHPTAAGRSRSWKGQQATAAAGQSMRDLLVRFCGEAIARGCAPNADSVPQDSTGGPAQLFEAGCHRACLDLLARLLLQHHQQHQLQHQLHTPASLRLWFARLALLVRTRQLSTAARLSCWRSGISTAPTCAVRHCGLLHAAIWAAPAPSPDCTSCPPVIDRIMPAGLSEAGLDLPPMTAEQRRASLELQRRKAAVAVYSVANNLATVAKDTPPRPGLAICSRRATTWAGAPIAPAERRDFYAAQLAVTSADWATAQRLFRSALDSNPGNMLAANNLAVICLYTGQLRRPSGLLESLLERQPKLAIHEGLVFNLCTMYDLEPASQSARRPGCLETVARHRGDNFDVAAF
uniref:TPR_REGION domain-containing protein n=1 Tax=Macrostomum lignano TaxID=282301 RepID=A0A1I8FHC3_9PLAT